MYIRKRDPRAWAVIPAVVLVVAISVGPPMLLGFLLGLIGVLVIFAWRKSVAARVIDIFTR